MSNWYTRPVFVSSTFKDMQSERDSLRDVVFGKIDEKLKAYQRRLEPIDLRWGVETVDTSEQESKELLVLKVCLDEIERCRPFLLVILGDRYGWIPPAQRMQAAVDKKGFATTVQGKSVTALEIEYGVLDSPEQNKRSFFYFRHINNYSDMPLITRAMYSDLHKGIVESKELSNNEKQALSDLCLAREKGLLTPADSSRLAQLMAKDPMVEQGHKLLEVLKRRIEQDPGLAGRVKPYEAHWQATDGPAGHVVVPATWTDTVGDDLWSELQQECEEVAGTIDTSGQGQERTALEEFVELRSRDFVGRESLLNELKTFAISPAQSDTWGLCLHGGPGTGKSALFAALVRKLQVEQKEGDFLLLAHAGGISPRAGNVDALLGRWIQEMAHFLKIKEEDLISGFATIEEIKKLFAELLSRTSAETRVICLIDALTQFERTTVARKLTWLPELWPKNARLITTCVAGSESEALGKRSGVALKELASLDEREAEAILKSICDRYHRTLHRDIIKRLLNKKTPDHRTSCANPLWLTIAVEQLNLLDEDDFTAADALAGSPEQKLHTFMLQTVTEFPPTIEELYSVLYRRADEHFGRRYGINWIPEMLEFIACTRFGLRETDLEELLCAIEAQKQSKANNVDFLIEFRINFALQFAAVRRYLRAHLMQRDELGAWDFTHVQGRKAAKISRFTEKDYHRLTAEHLEVLPRGDDLKTREIMWHYLQGDMKENAGKYYGRSDLDVKEKGAATKILAEAVLEGEGMAVNAGLEWLGEILAGITDNESTQWFSNKLVFDLDDALKDESDVRTRITLLDKARLAHEKLVASASDSTEFSRNLSAIYMKLGDLQLKSGHPPKALHYCQQALAKAEELCQRAPDSAKYARGLFESYVKMGDIQFQLGNPSEALRYYPQALSIAKELHQRDPDSADFARLLSISYERLGNIKLQLSHLNEALRYYQQADAMAEELCQRAPDSVEFARYLLFSYNNLGNLQLQLGNLSEALRYYQQALAIANKLRQRAPDSADFARDLSVSYEHLGNLQLELGHLPEALSYQQQALAIAEELRQRAPDSAEFAHDLSLNFNKLGNLHLQLGHSPEALHFYQQALAIAEELRQRAPDSANFARHLSSIYNNLGDLQLQLSHPSEALRYYQQALAIAEELRQRTPDSAEFAHDLSVSYIKLGDLQFQLGHTAETLRYYEQAHAITEELRQQAPDSANFSLGLSVSCERLGNIHLQLGNPPEALRYYQQCLTIREKLRQRAPDSTEYARGLLVSYMKIGDLQFQLGHLPEALRYHQQALALAEELRQRAPDSVEFARDLLAGYIKIGDLQFQLGHLPEALRYHQQALALAEELRQRAPDSVEFARDLSLSYIRLGELHFQLGHPPEALHYYQLCLTLREELRQQAPDSTNFARDLSFICNNLGDLQLQLGHLPEALRFYQQALAIGEELRQRAPDSAEFARDLFVSYIKIGDLQLQLGNPSEALSYHQQALAKAEELRQRAPDSAELARNLSVSYIKIGDLQLQLGHSPEALRYYQQQNAIAEELRQRAPDSQEFARDLVVSYYKLASFCGLQNKNHEANKYWALCKQAILCMKQRGMFVDPPIEGVLKQIEDMGI